MAKLSQKKRAELRKTEEGRKRVNIIEWSAHCDKLEARKETLTDEEREDLQFRRMQVKRWEAELK